jgi:hypothetical protein
MKYRTILDLLRKDKTLQLLVFDPSLNQYRVRIMNYNECDYLDLESDNQFTDEEILNVFSRCCFCPEDGMDKIEANTFVPAMKIYDKYHGLIIKHMDIL